MYGHWHRRRGLSELILSLLSKKGEMTGAQIIREIEKVTQGIWRPSPGAIYPALDKLESNELISVSKAEKGQKYYQITEKGRKLLAPQSNLDVVIGDVEYNIRYIVENKELINAEIRERLRRILSQLEEILNDQS
ncbi:MAG: PadR family transcriptional regulator [Metallosphaera sp.]|uniref:PadR family transcriptional regulator n=1 Tax=Metallosphaera sp. TaxID=2020860 RepID=UPI0031671AFF